MIRECYPDEKRVKIYALADLTNENDITPDWGRYVLENVDKYVFKVPELMIYGNDEARSRWFDLNDIKDMAEIIIPRSRLEISATQLRELMVWDQRRKWMQWVDPKLHKMYDELRAELMAVPFYQEKRMQYELEQMNK